MAIAWQINIHRSDYSVPVDMKAVIAVCADLMTDDEIDGPYIYVNADDVSVAVERINALGYETDEDVNEEAAFHAEDTKYDEDNWQEFAAEQQAQRDRFNLDA
jgi:hypothetical protein